MNMPLNIDWQQILLHLLNFCILTLGLYLLLYQPVKKFMAQRAAHYQALGDEAEQKLKQAQALESSYREREENLKTAIDEKKAAAAQKAQQAADQLLQNAEKQAKRLLADAQQAAQQERADMLQSSRREIARLAIATTEKLLAQSSSDTLDQFLATAKKE